MYKKLTQVILFITLPIAFLLVSFSYSVLDNNYFDMKFKENNIEQATGIEHKNLLKISEEILKYLKDERKDLIIYEEVNGQKEQIFEDRELQHMKDVKKLFNYGFLIRNISIIMLIISISYLLIKDKIVLLKTIRASSIMGLVLIGILGIIMIFNFDKAFTIFHKILFTNDLWILNPKTDIMIQMLPLNFFIDLGFKIVKIFIIALLLIMLISNIILKQLKKSYE